MIIAAAAASAAAAAGAAADVDAYAAAASFPVSFKICPGHAAPSFYPLLLLPLSPSLSLLHPPLSLPSSFKVAMVSLTSCYQFCTW